jgi:transcriptional regulator with XRE-family HTH domain
MLREWRLRRRLSQLGLALEADVSQRHLSYVESGRAMPSREMVLRLARFLDIPLRERNALLIAAGFAPAFPRRPLSDPTLRAAREAIEGVLTAQMPYPALALDRDWCMVAANGAVMPLMEGVAPALLAPPVNVLRASLHPEGLAPRIVNLPEWRAHLLDRLSHQAALLADPAQRALLQELRSYPGEAAEPRAHDPGAVAMPLRLRCRSGGVLSFLSTTTVFGTPMEVTLSELFIESFLPADAATAEALRHAASAG